MALKEHELETAETLYRSWGTGKSVPTALKRQLGRTSKSLAGLAKAISDELADGADRPIVKRETGQKFSTTPANQVGGRPEVQKLPTADDLACLVTSYRQALNEESRRASERAQL